MTATTYASTIVTFEPSIRSFEVRAETTEHQIPDTLLLFPTVEGHVDLLAILARAQCLNIDLLNIAHTTKLDLGKGGTGEVVESLQNVEFDFAFKKLKVPPGRSSLPEPILRTYYNCILNEITILGQPIIAKHKGIVDLYGITWEVGVSQEDQPENMYPVLVFQKAQHGTLRDFMERDRTKKPFLGFHERLSLCVQIGASILSLHINRIVHGDVKPQNILMFNDAQGTVPKLTDFGFSRIYSKANDRFWLAGTPGWNAPEWALSSLFTFDDAKKTDIYSFGKVCHYIFFGPYDDGSELLETEQGKNESASAQGSLLRILSSCLEVNPRRRRNDMATIVQQLQLMMVSPIPSFSAEPCQNVINIQNLAHCIPEVGTHYASLARAHYFVRGQMARELEHRLSEGCQDCKFNAMVQLALCLKYGFGLPKDLDRSRQLLRSSGASDQYFADIQYAVSKSYRRPENIGPLKDRAATGTIVWSGHWGISYARSGILKHAIETLEIERSAKIGLGHGDGPWNHYLALTDELANVYSHNREKSKAIKELSSLLSHLEQGTLDGERSKTSAYLLNTKAQLADGLWAQDTEDQRTRAIYLAREVLESEIQRSAELGQSTHRSMRVPEAKWRLAQMLCRRAEFRDEADRLCDEVLAVRIEVLGGRHPLTYTAMNWICKRLYEYALENNDQSRMEKALEIARKCLTFVQTDWKEHHEIMSTLMNNMASYLASIDGGKGHEEEILDLSEKALHLRERFYGPEHRRTLQAMDNLSIAYNDYGKPEEAIELERKLLNIRNDLIQHGALDERHTLATITGKAELADKLKTKGDQHETEVYQLRRQVLDGYSRLLGQEAEETQLASKSYRRYARDFAGSLEKQKRTADAVEVHREVLGHAKNFSEIDKTLVPTAVMYLAKALVKHSGTLMKAGDTEAGATAQEEAIALMSSSFGKSDKYTLSVMQDIARDRTRFDRHDAAIELRRQILHTVEEAGTSFEHMDIKSCFQSLGLALSSQARYRVRVEDWEQATKIWVEQLALSKKYLGIGNNDTFDIAENLAKVYKHQDEEGMAVDLYQQLLDEARAELGITHDTSLRYMRRVGSILRHTSRYEAAIDLYSELIGLLTAAKDKNFEHIIYRTMDIASCYIGLAENAVPSNASKDQKPTPFESLLAGRERIAFQNEMIARGLKFHHDAIDAALSAEDPNLKLVAMAVGDLASSVSKQAKMVRAQCNALAGHEKVLSKEATLAKHRSRIPKEASNSSLSGKAQESD